MGFGDKLKGLKDQAQQAVAENKDRIQDAVQIAGDVANTKTHGKYANKIAKVGTKVEAGVDKFAESAPAGADSTSASAAAAAPAAEAAPASETPDPAFDIEGGAPTEDSASAPIAHEPPPNPVTPTAADQASSGFPDFE